MEMEREIFYSINWECKKKKLKVGDIEDDIKTQILDNEN